MIENRHDITLELIGSIYEAALDMDLWPSVLRQIAEAIESTSGTLLVQDANSKEVSFMTTWGLDEKLLNDYEAYYYQLEPWYEVLDSKPGGTMVITSDIYPVQELEKSEFYNDWCKENGVFHAMGGYIEKTRDYIAKFGLQRPKKLPFYSEHELSFLRILQPHIHRALKINQQFAKLVNNNYSFQSLLDRINMGIVFINESEHVIYFNQLADSILQQQRNLKLTNNKLIARNPQDTKILNKHIHEAVQTGLGQGLLPGGRVFLRHEENKHNLQIQVLPLSTNNNNIGMAEYHICAVVFIQGAGNHEALPKEALRLIYGLTTAESRLVGSLMDGLSLNQIADKFQLSKHTVRNQLKSCFTKTGTHSQLELVRLVIGNHFTSNADGVGLSPQ